MSVFLSRIYSITKLVYLHVTVLSEDSQSTRSRNSKSERRMRVFEHRRGDRKAPKQAPRTRAEFPDRYDVCAISVDKRSSGAFLWSNNRIRLFSPAKMYAPAPIFTLSRIWNCYEYFHDLSDLMPFFHVFFMIT